MHEHGQRGALLCCHPLRAPATALRSACPGPLLTHLNAQVTLLLQFLATPAGAAAVNATLAIPQADRAAIIGLPGLVDATQARRTFASCWVGRASAG